MSQHAQSSFHMSKSAQDNNPSLQPTYFLYFFATQAHASCALWDFLEPDQLLGVRRDGVREGVSHALPMHILLHFKNSMFDSEKKTACIF